MKSSCKPSECVGHRRREMLEECRLDLHIRILANLDAIAIIEAELEDLENECTCTCDKGY